MMSKMSVETKLIILISFVLVNSATETTVNLDEKFINANLNEFMVLFLLLNVWFLSNNYKIYFNVLFVCFLMMHLNTF